MPKTKKKFIDRKKAVTFNLVHRSQRDPLAADETAPQRVLVPVNANVPSSSKSEKQELTNEQRREEQQKYGIYFDDDYNYLQHLKDTREVTMVVQPKPIHKRKEKQAKEAEEDDTEIKVTEVKNTLQLPSSVFASEVEENVGLLNKQATQGLCLDLDPEVVAALDEDFDFDDPENQLEDNFIELAMAEGGDDDFDEEDEESMSEDDSEKAFDSSEPNSDDDSKEQPNRRPKMPSWDQHDTKSRFSQYSMTSSVMRRNEGLTLLDNKFEKMFAEYDDTELGALDLEEIDGYLPETDDMLLQAAKEFEDRGKKYTLDKEREIARLQRLQEESEESEEELETVEVQEKEKWDCESILSTYSNLYNHPKLIQEPKRQKKIRINPKTGLPMDTLGNDNKLTLKSLAKFNAMNENEGGMDDDSKTQAESVLSTLSVLSIRPKDEKPEEKKERKRLLKEYRKERRIEKKANQEAFKEEKKRQEKIMLNNRNNVQGNKIL